MLTQNPKGPDALPEKSDHAYVMASPTPMDTERSSDKRGREDASAPSTPSKEPARKLSKPTEDVVPGSAILAAINKLTMKFDSQEDRMKEFDAKLTQNCAMLVGLSKTIEFNAAEIKDCKAKVASLESETSHLQAEVAVLRERCSEHDNYKRRWNLRIKGMKEAMNENTRHEVIEMLKKVAPQWADKMNENVDTVHRLGRKEDGRVRNIIVQFTRRQCRDAIWEMTKDSTVCKNAGIRFAEDLTKEAKEARAALWPRIKQARQENKRAYFRGPHGYIDGRRITA